MEVYQTVIGSSLELETFDGNGDALDLTLYDEAESFLRLAYPTGSVDKAIRFGTGNIVYYDIEEGDFDENETVQGQLFLIKETGGAVTLRKPLEIFAIEVLRILEAPTP